MRRFHAGNRRVGALYTFSLLMYRQWWVWLGSSAFIGLTWLTGPDPSRDAHVVAPVLAVTTAVGLVLLVQRRRGKRTGRSGSSGRRTQPRA